MRTESEEHMTTGMIGAYQPELAVLRKAPDGIATTFRDTVYEEEDGRVVLKRMMVVGDRRFIVTSIFLEDSSATVTDRYLSYIDAELQKDVRRD